MKNTKIVIKQQI